MTIREQAIRLCEYASCADYPPYESAKLVLLSQFLPEAGQLAEDALYAVCIDPVAYHNLSFREMWAESAQRLREGWTP